MQNIFLSIDLLLTTYAFLGSTGLQNKYYNEYSGKKPQCINLKNQKSFLKITNLFKRYNSITTFRFTSDKNQL